MRRRAPYIQNPVGEAIGPWNDSLGSAGEDNSDYDRDGFVQSDGEEPEYESDDNDEFVDDGGADDDYCGDSDGSTGLTVEMNHSKRHLRKHRRTNIIPSDEEEVEECVPVGRLGKWYRVSYDSSKE